MKKLVSLITIACFLVSCGPAEALRAAIDVRASSPQLVQAFEDLVVPPDLGRITDSRSLGSRQVVINIQDLHCNPEAQKKIAAILSSLDRKYRLRAVYVEGGYGAVDTSWLCGVADAKLKNEILETLLAAGKLTGSEYYSVSANRPRVLQGIEDRPLHRANIIRLGKILEREPRYEKILRQLEADLHFMEARYCSAKNKRFNALVERYRAGKVPADKYYSLLAAYARKMHRDPGAYRLLTPVSPDDYPALRDYLELNRLGKELRYTRAAAQMQGFMRILKTRLPYGVYNDLLAKTDNLSRLDDLYVHLARLSRSTGLGAEYERAFPDLFTFFDYTEKSRELNPLALLQEEKKLTAAIRLGLSRDIGELEVSFLSDYFACFRDYLSNTLSPDDYAYFADKFEKFKLTWNKYALVDRLPGLADDFALLDDYYRANCRRNDSFIRNIPELADARGSGPDGAPLPGLLNGAEPVVVVTGGFHSEGLKKIFADRNISYLTVTPNVTGDAQSSTETYEALARRQAQLFGAQALALALGSTRAKAVSIERDRVVVDLNGDPVTLVRDPAGLLRIAGPSTGIPAAKKQDMRAVETAVNEVSRIAAAIEQCTDPLKTADLILSLCAAFGSWGAQQGMFGGDGLIWEIASDANVQKALQRYDGLPVDAIGRLPDSLQRALAQRARRIERRDAVFSDREARTLVKSILAVPGVGNLLAGGMQSLAPDFARTSYLLDQVGYAGDGDVRQALQDPVRSKLMIAGLFTGQRFFVQNNRKLNRNSQCSGKCWFCYAHRAPMQDRQRETQPIAIAHGAAIVSQALALGFTDIQVNGEDTLDDLESFWAIVDACRDKPIHFSFFSSAFRFIHNPQSSLEFFTGLKERLGNVNSLSFTLSWDPEKIERAKNSPQFKGDEEAVLKAMAEVIHNFRQVFPAEKIDSSLMGNHVLTVDAHDLGTGNEAQTDKRYDEFHRRLRAHLVGDFGHGQTEFLYSHPEYATLQFLTPEAVVEGVKRGRIYQLFPVSKLYAKMAERLRSTCSYSPFFDMAMGEIVTCIRREEYPRRAVTRENFADTLLKPFSNPRSRHLFLGDDNARSLALVKQLGFALALDPSLGTAMQRSFEEVEAHLFSSENMMTKIELLFLLEDLLRDPAEFGRDKGTFTLTRVPRELLDVMTNKEIVTALLTYYAQYLPEGDRIPSAIPRPLIEQFKTDPRAAVRSLQELLQNTLADRARAGGAALVDVKNIPVQFSKAATYAEATPLPTLESLGFSVQERLQDLSRGTAEERKPGFDLLATLTGAGYDLTQVKDILTAALTPERLTAGEQELAVQLLAGWARTRPGHETFAAQLLTPFIFNAPDGTAEQALKAILALDDLTGARNAGKDRSAEEKYLTPDLLGRVRLGKAGLVHRLDPATRILLCRKYLESGLLQPAEAKAEATLIPLLGDREPILKEIEKWGENAGPFLDFLTRALSRAKDGYEKARVARVLMQTGEGRTIVLRTVQAAGQKEEGVFILYALEMLIGSPDTKPAAVSFLGSLPLSFFERQEIFATLSRSRLPKTLLPSHTGPGMKLLIDCLEKMPGGLNTANNRAKYFEMKNQAAGAAGSAGIVRFMDMPGKDTEPDGFAASPRRELAPGIEVASLSLKLPGVYARGEVHYLDPRAARLTVLTDERILARDIVDQPLVDNDPVGGYTVQDWVQQMRDPDSAVAAFNLSQGHGWEPNTLTIVDGKVQMRQWGKRGFEQKVYEQPHGIFHVFSFDADKPGVFDIEINALGNPAGEIPVRSGFAGVLLMRGGVPAIDRIQYGRICLDGDTVGWKSLKDHHLALTVYGYTKDGKIAIIQLAGDPNAKEKGEPTLYDLPRVLEQLGITDAVLGGTSGDVQRYHRDGAPEVLTAEGRKGSIFQARVGTPAGQRRVGQALIVESAPDGGKTRGPSLAPGQRTLGDWFALPGAGKEVNNYSVLFPPFDYNPLSEDDLRVLREEQRENPGSPYLAAARNVLGMSIDEAVAAAPDSFTTKAVLIVTLNMLYYERFLKRNHVPPSYVIGHSLGFFTAAAAAKAAGFEDVLRFTKQAIESSDAAGKEAGTYFAALRGNGTGDIRTLIETEFPRISLVTVYDDKWMNVIGPKEDMDALVARLERANLLCELPRMRPGFAIHSPYMGKHAERPTRLVEQMKIADPAIPIVSDLSGKILTTADEVRQDMIATIVRMVRISQAFTVLEKTPVQTVVGLRDLNLLQEVDRAVPGRFTGLFIHPDGTTDAPDAGKAARENEARPRKAVSVYHVTASADLRDVIPQYPADPRMTHIWFADLPQEKPEEKLSPIGIKVTVPGIVYPIDVWVSIVGSAMVFYIDLNKAGAAPSDYERLTRIGAAQIIAQMGGTDKTPANECAARRLRKICRDGRAKNCLATEFRPAAVVDHTGEPEWIKQELADNNVNTALVIPEERSRSLSPLAANAAIRKALLRANAVSAAMAENKVFKMDAVSIDKFIASPELFNALGNRQLLVDWGIFADALAARKITEAQIRAMLAYAKKQGVMVYCDYAARGQDTAPAALKVLGLGFAGMSLDLTALNDAQAGEFLAAFAWHPLLAVSAGVSLPPDVKRRKTMTLGSPSGRLDPGDVIEVRIPEGMSREQIRKAMAALPLGNTIIFHSGDAARLIDGSRDISERKAFASLLAMLVNFGNREITTAEEAGRVAYNWPVSDLPPTLPREAGKRQLQALLEGRLEGTGIPYDSAIGEQAAALPTPALKAAFLSGIAGKMCIRNRLQQDNPKLVKEYIRGAFTFRVPHHEAVLGTALAKQQLLTEREFVRSSAAISGSDTLFTYVARLSAEVYRDKPRPETLDAVIDVILRDLYGDYTLKKHQVGKQGTLDSNTIKAIFSAA